MLKLGELPPRVLDAVVHLEAFRAAHQAAAEDEEALEAAGILHRRPGALEHAVGLGDLLVDAGQFLAVDAAALGCGKLLLELHAADLLLAHALRQAIAAHERDGAEREHGKARTAGRPCTPSPRAKNRDKRSRLVPIPEEPPDALCPPKFGGQ